MKDEEKKVADTWVEGHEALLDLSKARLEATEEYVKAPEVDNSPPPTPESHPRNWILILAIFLCLWFTVATLYWWIDG